MPNGDTGIRNILGGLNTLAQTEREQEARRRQRALQGVGMVTQLAQVAPMTSEDAQKVQTAFESDEPDALRGIAGMIAKAYETGGFNKRETQKLQRQKLKAEIEEFGKPFEETKEGQKFIKKLELKAKAPVGFRKSLSAKDVMNVNEGTVIPNQLTDIENTIANNADMFGPIGGRIGSLNPYDTQAQTIESQIRASSQAFGRYMEGGVLRKEDEEKYRRMFPNLSDTPDVAANKLSNVRRLLVNRQSSMMDALKRSGFDVSGIEFAEQAPAVPEIISGKEPPVVVEPVQAPAESREEKIQYLRSRPEFLRQLGIE